MQMKNRFYLPTFMFIFCFLMLRTSLSFGQEQIIFKGTVRDSITKQVLSNVRISINNDMVGIQNNVNGEFQITAPKGSKVWFRKQGYKWKNIVVTSNNVVIIDIPQSLSSSPSFLSNNPNREHEYYFNGVLIPKEEWNDIRFSKDDIEEIRTNPSEKIMKFYFITK